MKVFSNFKELIDYVPNCIICGKLMELHLKCSIRTNPASKHWSLDHLHFHLKMKDNTLVGNCKKYSIAINPINNNIILGQNIFNELLTNWVTVLKKCHTCHCILNTKYTGGSTKNYKNFPSLTLANEEIFYTRKRNKLVSISQDYYDNPNILETRTMITVNGKLINPLYMDFNKFKNLNHLNERLSTILTFS